MTRARGHDRGMANDLTFRITRTRFDEDYSPADSSRLTTNFANLARGEHRQQNLRNALGMIDERANDLAAPSASAAATSASHASSASPAGVTRRYAVELDIVSVTAEFDDGATDVAFPLLEMLDVTIVDQHTGERHHGILGNNFSSYLRDYDFSVLLPTLDKSAGIPPTSGSCTADCSSASWSPTPSGPSSTRSPSSASASPRARPTARPRRSTPCSAPSTRTSTPR